jgi:hypothetical protein
MAERHTLSDEEMDEIAERAAKRALELVYAEVGKSVLKKLLWLLGTASIALLTWLKAKGIV